MEKVKIIIVVEVKLEKGDEKNNLFLDREKALLEVKNNFKIEKITFAE